MTKYKSACSSLRPGQLNNLVTKLIKDNSIYNVKNIDIFTKQMNPFNLFKYLHNKIDIAIAFRPNKAVWDITQQSRYIETILLRLPLSPFYLTVDNGKLIILDGVQRLNTFNNFIFRQTECFLKLKELLYYKFNGCLFCDLPKQFQRIILEQQLTVHIIGETVPDEIKKDIISRCVK